MKLLRIVLLILSTYLIIGTAIELLDRDDRIGPFNIEALNFIVTTIVVILVVVMRIIRLLTNEKNKENK